MRSQDTIRRGIFLMMGFVVFGPFIDLFAKLATQHMPVMQVAVGRFVVQGALLVPIVALLGRYTLPPRRDVLLYLARGCLILASTGFIVGAVKFMPLADAIAIVFVEPLILLLMGWLFLGESIGPRRLLACIFGFLGALLVIQPSFEVFGAVALLPLCCAICFALYLLVTREMAQRVDPLVLQANTSIGALAIGLPLLSAFNGTGLDWIDPVPLAGDGLRLVGLTGLAATVSHLFLTYAFRFAPVGVLGTVHYLEIVTAAILGYLVFGDVFGGIAALGAAIIILSGLFLIWRERGQEAQNTA